MYASPATAEVLLLRVKRRFYPGSYLVVRIS
jgi:hypothetical protein